ncbi:macrophage mannose receptor 1-like [Pelmatolapia mariae]|uniref:macrophage mannose receptor 1-like n=1 Tax=Pelmatolapia mariae TaxID=158779 RepID=UPI002FE5F6E9
MQWSLFLLLLMGQCVFITCHLYEYHFIQEQMSWDEARAYCREKYTDLAKVFDLTDMRRLQDSAQSQTEAWIGLYSEPGGDNRRWHWSRPGEEYTENETCWGGGEPNNSEYPENCVITRNKWADYPCSDTFQFICYDEKKKDNKTFHLIKTSVNWTQAQSHCRQHHTDLASGLDQIYSEEFKNLQNSTALWIGLFRDSWRWSDGSNFSFRYWDTDNVILIQANKTWEEALYYCREKHHDLASITNLHEQQWFQEKAKNASTPFVWLGLRYTCTLGFWFWVTDEVAEYSNWDSKRKDDVCGVSGAMDTAGEQKWVSQPDNNKFNFFCSKH